MKTRFFFAIALLLCCGTLIVAQTNVHIQKATLSIPFGEVHGKLLIVGNHLIFIDEERDDSSFAIDREMVRNVEGNDKEVLVETKEPITDRSGARTRLAFRLNSNDTASIIAWFEQRPTFSAVADTVSSRTRSLEDRAEVRVYDVKHKHSLFGDCQGKLVVTENMISFESFSERSHSRQYPFADIKTIKRNGPYGLEIQSFNRGSYKFELQGSGMDIADYKILEERIATARASR